MYNFYYCRYIFFRDQDAAGYKPCIISTIVDPGDVFNIDLGYKPCIISTIVDVIVQLRHEEAAISLV